MASWERCARAISALNPSWRAGRRCPNVRASQVALVVKDPPANAGSVRDVGSIPELGRSPGG